MKNAIICLVSIMLLIVAASDPASAAASASALATDDVAELAKSSGVTGGIVVHLGCGDGRETAKLLLDERFLVHGLDADDANVEQARENIRALKLYGKVSVAKHDGGPLPYTNDLVNLLIDSSGGKLATPEEIIRVLVPGGVALIDGKKVVKPWPAEIDQWTHYLHGPDNNAVAQDTRVAMPRSIQWVSGPRWGRSHEELASMSAAVSANGRMFYIVDEAPLASIRFLGNWKLVARDAFNGTFLWNREIPLWNDHLRHFRSGPTHLPRRLVAVGDVVYATAGLAGPVTALDAASGETRRIYEGTERTEEILVDDGVLYLVVGTSEANRRGGGLFRRGEPKPTDFRYVAAIEADSGTPLWKKTFGNDEFLLPLTLAVKGKRLFYQSTFGVVCLDAPSGNELWRTARPTPQRRMGFSAPTLVATDDVLLCADRTPGKTEEDQPATGTVQWGVHGWNESGFPRRGPMSLRAYSTKDGRELWSAPCAEGYNSPVDLFVIDDVVWVGTDFKGYDLKTGEVKREINTKGDRVGMPHHRCYRDKASQRFIFTGRSGIEVLSLDEGWLGNNSWIRGTCQYGIIPANGFLYAPPDACACFLTVKAPGFYAAAPQRDESGRMPFPDEPVLERGPLYGKAMEDGTPRAGDWPTYRHDAARSGRASSSLPDTLTEHWSADLGGRLTPPVVAGGKVFVASIDTHTLHALAEDDGREVWRYTAGGRIDSPPTVYRGTVLFGSADGWIHCLGAEDGRLVWRFRAAPKDRLVGAYGQLESAWPAHGAVLVQNDTLYTTAGRSSFTDGGIVLYRIDPATGKELSKTMVYHLDPDTGRQLVSEKGFNMEGTTSDILSGDGDAVFLRHFCFDRDAKRIPEARPHLFSITGFLGEEWFVRSYWVLGTGVKGAGWGGWANTANAFPAGRILCFDESNVYGYGRKTVANGPVGHRADAYHLFCRARAPGAAEPVATEPRKPRGAGGKGRTPKQPSPVVWSNEKSLIARAMVLTPDRLILAGPPDRGQKAPNLLAFENENEALAAFGGEKGVFLQVVAAAEGTTLARYELEAMPVFDGMAAASGKLFISLKDGTVECWGKE